MFSKITESNEFITGTWLQINLLMLIQFWISDQIKSNIFLRFNVFLIISWAYFDLQRKIKFQTPDAGNSIEISPPHFQQMKWEMFSHAQTVSCDLSAVLDDFTMKTYLFCWIIKLYFLLIWKIWKTCQFLHSFSNADIHLFSCCSWKRKGENYFVFMIQVQICAQSQTWNIWIGFKHM